MSLKISMPQPDMDLKPRITVVGVGGAGGNAVNNMIRSNLSGVEFLVANTDAQALEMSSWLSEAFRDRPEKVPFGMWRSPLEGMAQCGSRG